MRGFYHSLDFLEVHSFFPGSSLSPDHFEILRNGGLFFVFCLGPDSVDHFIIVFFLSLKKSRDHLVDPVVRAVLGLNTGWRMWCGRIYYYYFFYHNSQLTSMAELLLGQIVATARGTFG